MGLAMAGCQCNCLLLNWRRVAKTLYFILTILAFLDVRFCMARHKTALEQCKQGEYREGYALSGGKRAGLYEKLGTVEDFDECVDLCCSDDNCEVALKLRTSCFRVTCDPSKPELCKPMAAKHSKYHPMLFRRLRTESLANVGESIKSISPANNKEDSLPTLMRVKRGKASCHKFSGTACANYVNQSASYYVSSIGVDQIDHRIHQAIYFIEREFDSPCKEYALQAVCMFWLAQCKDGLPKPLMLCKEDCTTFFRRKCEDQISNEIPKKVLDLLPDCRKLPWAKDGPAGSCLHVPDSRVTGSLTVPTSAVSRSPASFHSDIPRTANRNISIANSSDTVSTPTLDESVETALPTTLTTAVPTTQPIESVTTAATTHPPEQSSSASPAVSRLQQTHAVVITTNQSSTDEVDLAVKESNVTEQPTTVPPVTHKPTIPVTTVGAIQVSAGENKVLTLPQNEVTLYASAWPKPANGKNYDFNWYQLSAPKGSTGYMAGQHSSDVHLTKLDKVGIYQFKVIVKGVQSYGEGLVNVTVKPAPRLNHPPRADVQPKEQTITLPTNEVVIDGSKSSDDDKIAKYKWELTKAPIETHGKVTMIGDDSAILQLKKLTAGVYTFKLTVTDSNGEIDSIESTVIVNDEKDYPPVARAGNDVVLTMPKNQVTLYGNGSSDDKGIVSYEWSKSPDSPKVGDIQGTDKPSLKVSNLVVGDYTFVLKVTDASGQSSESRVTVIVKPERNLAPKANAGPDKDLVFPDDSTTLDASGSTDDQRIVKFQWEKVSGPKSFAMSGKSKPKLHLTKLIEGRYVFAVTVTDERGLSSKDTVNINVKRDVNLPPVADAGSDVVVVLPNRASRLDGSKSKDDQWITTYKWTRDGSSPAAGDVINGSDASPILQLANLVEGVYTFTLAVTDNKGLLGYDSATIVVKDGTDSLHLVELYLDVDILKFTEENKKQLLRKLSVLLNVDDTKVVVDWIRPAGYGKGLMILFYVQAQNVDRKLDGLLVADMIKQKIGYHGTLFEYKMLAVQPYICRNNCSGHGTCDKNTKKCVCDSFWMSNVFKANFGAMESNCDWSILYVSVSLFCILAAVIGLSWLICYCFSRKTRHRRRGRYIAVRSEDGDESKENILLMSKGKTLAHSLTFTESDDSEEETTVFDKKRMLNGVVHSNGSANGGSKRFREHDM